MEEKKQDHSKNDDICDVRIVHLDRVSQAKLETVPDRDLDRMAMTYKMLGDPTRLKIVMALRNQEMCVCDLAAFTGLSESAVSHQLRRMRDLFLVKKRREGQIIYYSLDDSHVTDLIEIGLIHVQERNRG